MAKFTGYRCSICNTEYLPGQVTYTCPKDGGNLDIVLDYDAIRQKFQPEDLTSRAEDSLWRYLPLLPVPDPGGIGTPLRAAGWTPVFALPESTGCVMREKGIDISAQHPKPVVSLDLKGYDLIVNMTGLSIPSLSSDHTRNWVVPDPVGRPDSMLREVRDEIESLVMGLVLELRRSMEQREQPRLNPKLRGV